MRWLNCLRFSDIFWIDASSESSIELTIMQIAQANNLSSNGKQTTRSVLQQISLRSRWLLVYDNADGHYSVVERFLPPINGGNVLITSRNPELRRITSNKNSMEVVGMTEEEAVSLLLESAELYTRERDKLMTSADFRGASDYGRNTYETWDISMQKIDDMAKSIGREAAAAETAIKLLRIFAFLDNTNIPEGLFKNAAENFVRNVNEGKNGLPLLLNFLNHQTLLLNEDGRWEKTKFLAGIQVLLSFSFIKAYNHLYSIHLLVHAWGRARIPVTGLLYSPRTYLFIKASRPQG